MWTARNQPELENQPMAPLNIMSEKWYRRRRKSSDQNGDTLLKDFLGGHIDIPVALHQYEDRGHDGIR